MPVLLRHRGASGYGASLTLTARTVQVQGADLTLYARTAPESRGGTLLLSAQTAPLALGAQLRFSVNRPTTLEAVSGGPYLETESRVLGLPGPVLSWSYTHSGTYEELSVTVAGQHGLALPSATLNATAHLHDSGGRRLFSRLPDRTFVTLGSEPQVDVRADTTQFQFRTSRDQALRGTRLPELIPWKLNPSPEPTGRACLRIRQRQGVSTLVHRVMREQVDPAFVLTVDPLASAEWVEGERDYSTENVTPQQLWDATYGLLGMVLWLEPMGTGSRLIGRWPQPHRISLSPEPPDRFTLGKTQRRERLQTPTTLTVRGAPQATEKTPTALLGWLGNDHPAYPDVLRELTPDMTWYEGPSSAGDGLVWRGYRRGDGQIVEQVEYTTASISVTETVDGEVKTRNFGRVGTSYKYTSTTYDPQCRDRPIQQRTVTKSWGFDYSTQTGGFQITGPGVADNLTVGDPTGDEESITTYVYAAQGYLAAKTTTTKRLASLKQQGAEGDVAERGPLQGREYVTTLQTESWMPLGGGQWLHEAGVSGQVLMPVYDVESGEAVRTASLLRATPTAPEVTDQGPPMPSCPSPCAPDVLDEGGVVLTVGDAGFAEPREVSLPFVAPANLVGLAQQLIAQDWHRIVTEYALAYPLGLVPGQEFAGGMMREVRMSGSANTLDTTVTVAALDTMFGAPGGALSGLTTDPNRGRAIMLARTVGGATARVVTGWNPGTNQAIWERAFVAFRTGMPPAPGDEIEWELRRGQREAVRANR